MAIPKVAVFQNVEFRKGDIENSIPVEDHSVDAVISNCVINLTTDKARALQNFEEEWQRKNSHI